MAVQLEIVVEGVPLDLLPGEENRFFITKQVHDIIKSLSTREGDFSRNIDVPRTSINMALLDAIRSQAFEKQSTNFIPCEVFMSGIRVIEDGQIIVNQTSARSLAITIFGGSTNFFSQLSDEKLRELDLSAFNFEWTLANVIARANLDTGLVTPLCTFTDNDSLAFAEELGAVDVDLNLEVMNLQWGGFWFYFKSMLEIIFDNLRGLTVDFGAIDNADLNQLGFACTIPDFLTRWTNPPEYEGSGTDPDPPNLPAISAIKIGMFTLADPGGIWDAGNKWWIIPDAGLCLIEVQIDGVVKQINGLQGNNKIEVIINDTRPPIHTIILSDTQGGDIPYDETILTSFNASPGDTVQLLISTGSVQFGFSNEIDSFYFAVQKSGGSVDRNLNIADYMPDMTQKDFVLNYFKWFHIVPVQVDKVVTLKFWDAIPETPAALIKSAANDAITSSTLLQNYGQNSVIQYRPNPLVKRLDLTGSFPVFSNILPERLIVIELLFTGTDIYEGTTHNYLAGPFYGYDYQKIDNNKMNITTGGVYDTPDANGLNPGNIIRVSSQNFQVQSVSNSKTGTVVTPPPGVINSQDWERVNYIDHNNPDLHVGFIPGDVLLPNLLLNSNLTPGSKPPNNWNPFWNNLPTVQYIADAENAGGFLLDMTVIVADRDIIRQEIVLQLGFYTAFVEYFDYITASNRNARITAGTATINVIRDFRTGAQIGTESIDKDFCHFEVTAPGLVRMDIGCGQTGNGTAQMKMGRPMITPGLHDISVRYNPTNGTSTGTYKIADGAQSQIAAIDFKICLWNNFLTVEGLINNYFKNFARVIRSPVIIQIWLDLKTFEFAFLDNTAPIYIEELAQNFYINKIEQYKVKGLVRLELLRV